VENNSSEREQLEQLRRWWDAYGKSLAMGLALGLVGLFGYRYWNTAQETAALNTSINYQKFLEAASQGAGEDVTRTGEAVLEAYPDSTYAKLTALLLARLAVDDKKPDAARKHLEWVTARDADSELGIVARGRLAQLLLAEGDVEAAAKTIANFPTKGEYAPFAEVRADVLAARGEKDKAADLYRVAIDQISTSGGDPAHLEMKLDALGVELPSAAAK